MEAVNIDIGGKDNIEPISLDISEPPSNVNFGSGIELLMNDKKKSTSNGALDLGDLDNLENELNELSGNIDATHNNYGGESGGFANTINDIGSNLFGLNTNADTNIEIENDDLNADFTDSNLGNATSESMGTTKTWDGFIKANEVPMNQQFTSKSSNLNEREKRRKKRAMIKKLEEWYEKGLIKQNSGFTMESDFDEVEDEYETVLEEKRKKDSIKLQGWWFMTFINSLEYGNAIFNPFDLNLDGWGEQVSEDLDSYEEIFGELHDKYKGGKMAPEISLLLRVGFSAAVLNFSNKALSTATPAFNDVIKQSPELMKMFTEATASSMSQQSSGFAMANNFVQDNSRPKGPPPPAPVETQNRPPPPRPGANYSNEPPSNRPDISSGRGSMFREEGVSMKNEGSAEQERPIRTARPEMKGPQNSDIDNILSGLKTRTVNIHDQPKNADNDSMISISSLKEMNDANQPKRSQRRRNRSDKNTISLDI